MEESVIKCDVLYMFFKLSQFSRRKKGGEGRGKYRSKKERINDIDVNYYTGIFSITSPFHFVESFFSSLFFLFFFLLSFRHSSYFPLLPTEREESTVNKRDRWERRVNHPISPTRNIS